MVRAKQMRWLLGAVVLTVACGGETSSSGASGQSGSGGSAGAGGTGGSATGGSAGAGGTGGAAGSAGSGGAGGSAGTAGAGGTAGTGGSAGAAGSSGSSGSAGAGGSSCESLSDAIAAETSGVKTCSAVVRLDHQSMDVLGFQIICGSYGQVDETAARNTAQSDTGYGSGGTFLSGPDPEDAYVFYESPGDFGGTAAVNARNGLSVFGGSIIWSGTGEITYPATWRPAEELGPDCIPMVNALPPSARGFDLRDGTTLAGADVDAALSEAWNTALTDGLWKVGYVFDAVVLLYPRSVGAFDPTTAEWIVIVNAGWLE